MRALRGLGLGLAIVLSGCLGSYWSPHDDPEEGYWWEAGPAALIGAPLQGVEEREGHLKFHLRSYGVSLTPRSFDRYQTEGDIGLVAGDGWSILDLLEGEELNTSMHKDRRANAIAGAEHLNGKGILGLATLGGALIGYTSRDHGFFGTYYEDMVVCDILAIYGAVALLVMAPTRLIIYELEEGEIAMTTRIAENSAGFDSAFALGPKGPLVAADGKGDVWVYPTASGRFFREPMKSSVNVGPSTIRMRCVDGVCAASDHDSGRVTFFSIDEMGKPTGSKVSADVTGAGAIAELAYDGERYFWVTAHERLEGFELSADGAIARTRDFPLPADCPAPRDVDVSQPDAEGNVRILVGCGEDGAVLSRPFQPTRVYTGIRTTIF